MIHELVVVSGKGGTGKTSITAAFANLMESGILCDADVDAADMHLLTAPVTRTKTAFMGGFLANVREEDCSKCGQCKELCQFDAVSSDFEIDPMSCEGCGVCVQLCPEESIDFTQQQCGDWFVSDTRFGTMVHARLGIAEENSGKLVSLVRKEAFNIAEQNNSRLILTDGPPGIGCPVIAAIGGATVLIIVAEPTVSGMHDMERVVDLADHFKVPVMVCVNKYDLNPEKSEEVERYCKKRNIHLLGHIPFDPGFVEAMVEGKTILEYSWDGPASQVIRSIWENILNSDIVNGLSQREFSLSIQQ